MSDSLNSYTKLDNENQTIAYVDINLMYPHSLRKKVPIGKYKFIDIEKFDETKYGDNEDYNCFCYVM